MLLGLALLFILSRAAAWTPRGGPSQRSHLGPLLAIRRSSAPPINFAASLSPTDVLAALECYHAHHGDCFVPAAFHVPLPSLPLTTPRYPESTECMPLGRTVCYLRRLHLEHGPNPSSYSPPSSSSASSNTNTNASTTDGTDALAKQGGEAKPNQTAKPRPKPTSRPTWSKLLLPLLQHPPYRQRLDALGFVWDLAGHRRNRLVRAVRWYQHQHGPGSDVPTNYVIPALSAEEEAAWGADLGGYHLGSDVAFYKREAGKRAQARDHTTRPAATAAPAPPPATATATAAATATATATKPPKWTRAPSLPASYPSPKHTRGLALPLPSLSRRALDFRLVLQALRCHHEVYGDFLVPRYFVVPAEPPWPLACQGLQLGNRVRNIRYYGTYADAESQQQLRDLGFFDEGQGQG